MIYYDYLPNSLNSTTGFRNTTMMDYTSPLMVGFIGPSITPLSGNNTGWRVYHVDAKTFSVVGAQTYFTNVSAANSWTAPEWKLEYDTRTTYDPNGVWGKSNPLNTTFWHNVTTQMLSNITLVELYNFLETKIGVSLYIC
jgi:sphingomyelin phosphodiesterase